MALGTPLQAIVHSAAVGAAGAPAGLQEVRGRELGGDKEQEGQGHRSSPCAPTPGSTWHVQLLHEECRMHPGAGAQPCRWLANFGAAKPRPSPPSCPLPLPLYLFSAMLNRRLAVLDRHLGAVAPAVASPASATGRKRVNSAYPHRSRGVGLQDTQWVSPARRDAGLQVGDGGRVVGVW